MHNALGTFEPDLLGTVKIRTAGRLRSHWGRTALLLPIPEIVPVLSLDKSLEKLLSFQMKVSTILLADVSPIETKMLHLVVSGLHLVVSTVETVGLVENEMWVHIDLLLVVSHDLVSDTY